MESVTRTRLLTALVLFVVFGSGVMLGLAADSGLRAEEPDEVPVVTAEEAEPEPPATERRCIYCEVEPNEEELSRIESVIAEHRVRRDSLDREARARYNDARDVILLNTREAIKAVLSPEKAAEYQRLLDAFEAERAAVRENEDDRN